MYTNELCLAFFVNEKTSKNKLFNHEIIPNNFLGLKTDVIEASPPKLLNNISPSPDKEILRSYKRPVQPGYVISSQENLGTIGAIVFDEEKNPYILSNNHVLADNNKFNIGSKIMQPSFNESNKTSAIAYLYKQVIINISEKDSGNFVDCAIAKLLTDVPYTTEIYKIGKINGVKDAFPGMEVKKVGATTGFTTSTVTHINVSTIIKYDDTLVSFDECISCGKLGSKGDSGSLVLDNNNNAIGLLFGGGKDDRTLLNPIKSVLDILKVHF